MVTLMMMNDDGWRWRRAPELRCWMKHERGQSGRDCRRGSAKAENETSWHTLTNNVLVSWKLAKPPVKFWSGCRWDESSREPDRANQCPQSEATTAVSSSDAHRCKYTSMSVRAKYEHDLHLLVRVEDKNARLHQTHLGAFILSCLTFKRIVKRGFVCAFKASSPRAWREVGGSRNTGSGRCTCMALGTQRFPGEEDGF